MTSGLDVLPISIRISFNLFNSFELWQTRHALGLRLWIHLRFGLTILLWQSLTWRKDQKFPTSLICVIYTIWSQSACPETPETLKTLKTPETLATPLADRGLCGTFVARASDAADLMHDMHRASKGQMIRTRELQWTWEHGIQLHPAMSAYVSLCDIMSAMSMSISWSRKQTSYEQKNEYQYAAICPKMCTLQLRRKPTDCSATVLWPQRGLLHAPAGSLR